MTGGLLSVQTGPVIGETLIFVPINFAAALLTLLLIIRIGKGKLNIPIVLVAAGFLVTAVVPIVLGLEYLWVIPLVQTIFGSLAILAIMKIFGVFSLLKSHKPSIFVKKPLEPIPEEGIDNQVG